MTAGTGTNPAALNSCRSRKPGGSQAAREQVQRLAMMMWMQQREQKWDVRYKEDKVWGAGIMNMIAKTMKAVAQRQEEKEREREVTGSMDWWELGASEHAGTMREEGPEERQQPQQQPKPRSKLQLKLQPKPQPVPKPKSAPTL
jgi:outer membrane biosynthesis protein TonB